MTHQLATPPRAPYEGLARAADGPGSRWYQAGLVVACLVYVQPFVLGYFPMQEGWFQHFARLMQQGETPYKDFHLPLPPGILLQFRLFAMLPGTYVLPRLYGAVELCVLALVLFALARRCGRPSAAFGGSVLGLAVYLSNINDSVTSYYQTTLLLTLGSLLALVRAREAVTRQATMRWSLIGGILAGGALLTKQTALGVLLAIAVGILLWRRQTTSGGPSLSWAGAGVLLPVVPVLGWLAQQGALADFVREVFEGGSKGSGTDLLLGFVLRVSTTSIVCWSALAVLVLVAAAAGSGRFPTVQRPGSPRVAPAVIAASVGLLVATDVAVHSKRVGARVLGDTELPYLQHRGAWVLGFFYVVLALCAGLVVQRVVRRSESPNWVPRLLLTTALAWMYVHGLSGGLEPHGLLLAVAVLGTLGAERASAALGPVSVPGITAVAVVTLCASLAVRSTIPYLWWGWNEVPVGEPRASLDLPGLTAFHVPATDASFLRGITSAMDTSVGTDHTAYVFPFMPVFYDLTDTHSSARCQVAYFDICNDADATADAADLAAHPPSVIVYANLPESAWQAHETVFRGGHRSGQRDIALAVLTLQLQGKIRQVASFTTPGESAFDEWPVIVYQRVST